MEIKDYKPGDEDQILKLFQITFGKSMPEAYWKWRFIDNPENIIMIKLMWHNDILVGHYAVSPIKLNVNNSTVFTALVMTTMTHPDYAGRGIFTKLAETLYKDEEKRHGLKAVWGFPNNNAHYGVVNKLKWNNLDLIPTFSIDVKRIKESKSHEISTISTFNNSHIEAQIKVLGGYSIKIQKSVDYLNWRYLKNPVNNYDIFEFKSKSVSYYAVTKIFTSFVDKNKFEVDILELIFPDDFDYLLNLMNAIQDHYKQYEILKINTWLPLNDSKHLLLEKIGFVNALPITYSGIRVLDNNYNQLEESKGWFFSMGDSDIY